MRLVDGLLNDVIRQQVLTISHGSLQFASRKVSRTGGRP